MQTEGITSSCEIAVRTDTSCMPLCGPAPSAPEYDEKTSTVWQRADRLPHARRSLALCLEHHRCAIMGHPHCSAPQLPPRKGCAVNWWRLGNQQVCPRLTQGVIANGNSRGNGLVAGGDQEGIRRRDRAEIQARLREGARYELGSVRRGLAGSGLDSGEGRWVCGRAGLVRRAPRR